MLQRAAISRHAMVGKHGADWAIFWCPQTQEMPRARIDTLETRFNGGLIMSRALLRHRNCVSVGWCQEARLYVLSNRITIRMTRLGACLSRSSILYFYLLDTLFFKYFVILTFDTKCVMYQALFVVHEDRTKAGRPWCTCWSGSRWWWRWRPSSQEASSSRSRKQPSRQSSSRWWRLQYNE